VIEKLRSHLRKEKGFTLIELLVVIAIIAILVVMVVVVINPGERISQARDTTATNDARSVASGVGACITNVLALTPPEDPYDGNHCSDTAYLTNAAHSYLQNVPASVTFGETASTVWSCETGRAGHVAIWESDGQMTPASITSPAACGAIP
jgi:prepilin-type N-terminal cleavage/methylation domain-containing protein